VACVDAGGWTRACKHGSGSTGPVKWTKDYDSTGSNAYSNDTGNDPAGYCCLNCLGWKY